MTQENGQFSVEEFSNQLRQKQELVDLFQRRYNQEHQRGLELELAGQRAELRVAELQQEVEGLRARVTQLEKNSVVVEHELPHAKARTAKEKLNA